MNSTNLIPGLNLRTTFYGHEDVIHRIAWSPIGEIIALPSRDKTIIIWNCKKNKLVKRLRGHLCSICFKKHKINRRSWA